MSVKNVKKEKTEKLFFKRKPFDTRDNFVCKQLSWRCWCCRRSHCKSELLPRAVTVYRHCIGHVRKGRGVGDPLPSFLPSICSSAEGLIELSCTSIGLYFWVWVCACVYQCKNIHVYSRYAEATSSGAGTFRNIAAERIFYLQTFKSSRMGIIQRGRDSI